MKITRMLVFLCLVLPILAIWGVENTCQARGKGIAAGEGKLHPAIDLDLIYDTNPSYSSNDPVGDLILRIRPGLTLSFPSEKLAFELSGKVGYDYFFGVDRKQTTDLSTIAGEAQMQLGINPNGQVSFFLEDTFSRTGDPMYSSLTGKFNRTDNEAKAHFQIKPGGGALIFDLAYGFFIDWFDNTFVDAEALSSYAHRIYFAGKWKFLPKTAMTLDFDSDLRRYPGSYTDGTKNMDVNAVRATVGLLGQITPVIVLSVKAGYGDTVLPDVASYPGDNYRSVIGQAEVSFRFATTYIQAGYLRNFQPVVLFAFFGQDRLYARVRQQFADKFTLSADLGFDILAYGTAVEASAQQPRSDYLLTGTLSVDYHIQDWLEVGLAYDGQARFSDWQQPLAGAGGVDYNKHMFTLHIGVDY